MPRKILSTLAFALAVSSVAWAQSAHWDPPGGTLPWARYRHSSSSLTTAPRTTSPCLRRSKALRCDYQGQSSNISIINGTYSKNVSLTFAVLISRQQEIDIPEFTVNTNKGPIRGPRGALQPGRRNRSARRHLTGEAASARLTPLPNSVWAGEVFDLRYVIDVAEATTRAGGAEISNGTPVRL